MSINSDDEFALFRGAPLQTSEPVEAPGLEDDEIRKLERKIFGANPEPEGTGRPLVLIIDDDRNVRESLKIALNTNYRTTLCASGQEGVEVVHAGVSAVILDIKMEEKDGFETFKEIKQKFLHLPIIFHTAYQELKNPYEVINEYRPFGYISKEGSFRELLDTLNSAVEYYRQIHRNKSLLIRLRDQNTELEDKNSELKIKSELLQTYSNRVMTLLKSTKEMSVSREAQAAISVAASYILNSINAFDETTPVRVYMPDPFLRDENIAHSFLMTAGNIDNPASENVTDAERDMLRDVDGLTAGENRILVAATYEGRRHAIFSFENRVPDDLDEEEQFFISGILNSLALALENVRNLEQQRMVTIGQMASGIVHDVKNNVAIIKGFAELADDADLDAPTRQEYLALITKNADQLSGMALDILDFSRGRVELDKRSYDLGEYLEEVAGFLGPLFAENQVEFEHRLTREASLNFDGERFRRVIQNIAGNACDAMAAAAGGGKFTLEIAQDENRTLFHFRDDGPGIAQEIQDTIFQPFVTHGKSHGTGLGMAMVKSIVDAHGGEISFTTQPGGGTEFVVSLPA